MTARSRYLALRRQARDTGRPFSELLELYALEGFLRRLAASPHADKFVLKGGMLMAAFDTRRPTRDVDMQALDLVADAETLTRVVREILTTKIDDGLVYDAGDLTAESIRDEDDYTGVRLSASAMLDTAQMKLKLDISTGDPIRPGPEQIDVPALLDTDEPITMRGFPLTMVLAEKAVTAVERGTANTRWRDFGDIYLLAQRHEIDGRQLRMSVVTVAEHRGARLRPLSVVLANYAANEQGRWAAWRRKQNLDELLPDRFSDVLETVVRLVDPILEGDGASTWDPSQQTWV